MQWYCKLRGGRYRVQVGLGRASRHILRSHPRSWQASPPTVSITKSPSYISSCAGAVGEKRFELERDRIVRGAPVVVVDDVLSTGETLFATLKLIEEAGVAANDVTVLIVAEFPVHRGRELLLQRGFGQVHIQSLLVLAGR